MAIRTHIGISMDGFVATPAGIPAWDAIPTFGPGTHGYDELMAETGAIVMGRSSFDQGFRDWLAGGWPWPDKQVYVLTSSPLPDDVPARVFASKGGPEGLVEQIRAARMERDVQVLGGPRTIRAFMAIGALDRLEMVILPVLLGTGIPLFDIKPVAYSAEAFAAWQRSSGSIDARQFNLERQRVYPDGSIEVVYRPA